MPPYVHLLTPVNRKERDKDAGPSDGRMERLETMMLKLSEIVNSNKTGGMLVRALTTHPPPLPQKISISVQREVYFGGSLRFSRPVHTCTQHLPVEWHQCVNAVTALKATHEINIYERME